MSKPETYGELIEALIKVLPNNASIDSKRNGEIVIYTGLKRDTGNDLFVHDSDKLSVMNQG